MLQPADQLLSGKQFPLAPAGVPHVPLAVAMLIAVVKMLLVMLFFMHIRYEARLTRLFAGAGLLWLLFMIGLVMADVLSRNWR